MSDKLNLFEATIKRSLEHFEAPVPANAWDELEQKMTEQSRPAGMTGTGATANLEMASAGSGFLQKFLVAGAFLLGAILFINRSVGDEGIHVSDDSHHSAAMTTHSDSEVSALDTESNELALTDEASSPSEGDILIADGDIRNEDEISADESVDSSVPTEVTDEEESLEESEADRMASINERLQEAAEKAKEENAEERYTTRYVGKDFNLGAPKEFSPNEDGLHDSFIPSNLKSGDEFIMTVSSLKGEKIFSSQSIEQPWMGVDSAGKPVEEGRYRWEVVLQKDRKKEIFKGIVLLER